MRSRCAGEGRKPVSPHAERLEDVPGGVGVERLAGDASHDFAQDDDSEPIRPGFHRGVRAAAGEIVLTQPAKSA
jgi:hypothetical protein